MLTPHTANQTTQIRHTISRHDTAHHNHTHRRTNIDRDTQRTLYNRDTETQRPTLREEAPRHRQTHTETKLRRMNLCFCTEWSVRKFCKHIGIKLCVLLDVFNMTHKTGSRPSRRWQGSAICRASKFTRTAQSLNCYR